MLQHAGHNMSSADEQCCGCSLIPACGLGQSCAGTVLYLVEIMLLLLVQLLLYP
jgi:hypothetical protein